MVLRTRLRDLEAGCVIQPCCSSPPVCFGPRTWLRYWIGSGHVQGTLFMTAEEAGTMIRIEGFVVELKDLRTTMRRFRQVCATTE